MAGDLSTSVHPVSTLGSNLSIHPPFFRGGGSGQTGSSNTGNRLRSAAPKRLCGDPVTAAATPPRHGRTRYQKGCRCAVCSAAHHDAQKRYRLGVQRRRQEGAAQPVKSPPPPRASTGDLVLAAVIAAVATPPLQGARCVGRWGLFDEADPDEDSADVGARHRQALNLCQLCPAMSACARWVGALPATQRPSGVIAGRVNHHSPAAWPESSTNQEDA
ncbi:hypothetical protein BH09ACT7_BH09ACT7_05010 [soil metagenome]